VAGLTNESAVTHSDWGTGKQKTGRLFKCVDTVMAKKENNDARNMLIIGVPTRQV
jgi:hypothetical protein